MEPEGVGPYDLIHVFVGEKQVACRPIQWDPAKRPVEYMTTCTACKLLVKFPPSAIERINGKAAVVCNHCGAKPSAPRVDKSRPKFEDPIEAGRLHLRNAVRLE